jgi:site-specific recombinase XerC
VPRLAAFRMLLDWLTSGGMLPFDPAASVRGPKAHRQTRPRESGFIHDDDLRKK